MRDKQNHLTPNQNNKKARYESMKRLKRALCIVMAMVMMAGVSTEVSAVEADVTTCEHNAADFVVNITKATPTQEGKFESGCGKCGSMYHKYTIRKPELEVKSICDRYDYTGKPIKADFMVYGSDINEDDYTVTYKDNKNVGVATVIVTFKDTCEYYSGTMTDTFTIVPRAPKNFDSDSDYKTGKRTVKWKKVKEADGYQIQASMKKSFKGAKTYTIKKKNTTKKVIKDVIPAGYPEGGKLYRIYISMRSYKKVKVNGKTKTIYSDWKDKSWLVYKAHLVLK